MNRTSQPQSKIPLLDPFWWQIIDLDQPPTFLSPRSYHICHLNGFIIRKQALLSYVQLRFRIIVTVLDYPALFGLLYLEVLLEGLEFEGVEDFLLWGLFVFYVLVVEDVCHLLLVDGCLDQVAFEIAPEEHWSVDDHQNDD